MTPLYKTKGNIKSVIIPAILIILSIILSLCISLIPSYLSKTDITQNKMHTLGYISHNIASAVDEEITLYLIASEATQNQTVRTVMERYTKINPKIKVRLADPDKDSKFISLHYRGSVAENSILAVSEKRSKYIPYSSLFSYSAETYSGCYQLYTAYIQYGYLDSSSCDFQTFMTEIAPELAIYDGFDYELQISAAIKYVSDENLQNLYMLLGHNETISEDIVNRMNLNMYNFNGLNLENSELPSDTDCIMLMPNKDITEKEYGILSEYLANGGKLFLITSYAGKTDFPNLLKLTSDHGLTTEFDKYLCEDDENYNYLKYAAYIVPDISDKDSADMLEKNGASVMFSGATGITSNAKEGITLTPILTSSPKSYAKVPGDDIDSLKFNEETDSRSSYYVGVKADNASGGSLVWISSGALVYDDHDPFTLRGNKLLFTSLMNSLNGSDGVPEIEPKIPANEVIEPGAAYIYTFLAIMLLFAAAALTFGIVRCKKK